MHFIELVFTYESTAVEPCVGAQTVQRNAPKVRQHATDPMEMPVKTPNRILLTTAVAVAAMLTLLSTPTLAQTISHDHRAAKPHKLSLNHGRKWATDEPLRSGMDRIQGLVEPQLGASVELRAQLGRRAGKRSRLAQNHAAVLRARQADPGNGAGSSHAGELATGERK